MASSNLTPEGPEPAHIAKTSKIDIALLCFVLVGMIFLVALTFATSFHTGATVAHDSFGKYWDMTPVMAVDLGIVVLSIADVLLIRLDARWPLLRPGVWGLIAITFIFNTAGAKHGDRVGWLLHAAIPLIYVATWEVVRYWVRRHFQLSTGRARTRLAGPRASRYLLAPRETPKVRRLQILEEIPTFHEALRTHRSMTLPAASSTPALKASPSRIALPSGENTGGSDESADGRGAGRKSSRGSRRKVSRGARRKISRDTRRAAKAAGAVRDGHREEDRPDDETLKAEIRGKHASGEPGWMVFHEGRWKFSSTKIAKAHGVGTDRARRISAELTEEFERAASQPNVVQLHKTPEA